ncbi:hypothetical protein D9M68_173610 [compost metagenome]
MKKIITLLVFFCISNSFSKDFLEVDEIVKKYPSKVQNLETISNLIKKDFTDDSEKARAVYSWIAFNIEFDVAAAFSMKGPSDMVFSYRDEKEKKAKEIKFKETIISKALLSGKAICHGYSMLFERLSKLVGLESEIIIGNLKSDPSQIGQVNLATDHAWNAVKINNVWKFVDTTLGAGYVSQKDDSFKPDFNDSYFFISADDLFLNHYPEDKKWITINKSKQDFSKLPVYYRDYFKGNYKISPELGIISSSATNFHLEIKNLGEYDNAEYIFSSDNKLTYLNNENKETQFDIPLSGKSGDYLTIYVNRKIMVTYLVSR